jgi:hypothetical protein
MQTSQTVTATAAPQQPQAPERSGSGPIAALPAPPQGAVRPTTPQAPQVVVAPALPAGSRSDRTTLTLDPGQGLEVKMEMKQGAKVTYSWTVEGGSINHDTHGEPFGKKDATHSYSQGRGVAGDTGVLTALFDGTHGWFWRNRGSRTVTVRLTTSGEYGAIKRVN